METAQDQPEQPDSIEEFVDELFLRPEEFQEDAEAVHALRRFLASKEGRKFCRVIRGMNPAAKMATLDSVDPKIVRAAAHAEHESAQTLVGKIGGYQVIQNLIFQVLTKHRKPQQPNKQRGRRAIDPHPAQLPASL